MATSSIASISIETDQPESEKVREWASFLRAPINPTENSEYQFQMHFFNETLKVLDTEKRKLAIDFDLNHLDYKRTRHRGKNELIAKALGAGKGLKRVLDLSVGLGVDSVFLSQLGFQVQGVERSAVLYLLLNEAFKNSKRPELAQYLLHHNNSSDFLDNPKNLSDVDSIYFDPMYPHKKKSALPKQEMILFRQLVGDDIDAAEVLGKALRSSAKRVVVKRPLHAEELLPGVTHAYEGKVVRYDTYVLG